MILLLLNIERSLPVINVRTNEELLHDVNYESLFFLIFMKNLDAIRHLMDYFTRKEKAKSTGIE